MQIARTDAEVNELVDKCADAENNGTTRYPGMTYEQGIRAALEWVTGSQDGHPLEE